MLNPPLIADRSDSLGARSVLEPRSVTMVTSATPMFYMRINKCSPMSLVGIAGQERRYVQVPLTLMLYMH